MTGRLTLRVDQQPGRAGPVVVDVVDHAHGDGQSLAITTERTLDLPAGRYAIQGWLPTGQVVTATARVTSGGHAEVSIGGPDQGAERRGPPARVDTRPPTRSAQGFPPGTVARSPLPPDRSILTDDHPLTDGHPLAAPTEAGPTRRVWVSLWNSGGRRPEQLDGSTTVVEHGPASVSLGLTVPPGPFDLQVGGEDVPWHVVSLPPSRNPRATLSALAPEAGQHNGGVRLEAATTDPEVEALLGYLETGQLEQARVFGDDVLDAAVQMFRGKVASPEGAAVAGYYLLSLDEQDRVGDWPGNFDEHFPWLPDAQIIHAWSLLSEPDVPRRDTARERLLVAADSGIAPRYSQGVRLLQQGLRMFAATDPADEQVASALDWTGRLTEASDRSRPTTTYRASAPGRPSPERLVGRPETDVPVLELDLPLTYAPERRIRPREHQALSFAAEGLTTDQIATRMSITPKTVDNYLNTSLRRLRMSSIDGAAHLADELDA